MIYPIPTEVRTALVVQDLNNNYTIVADGLKYSDDKIYIKDYSNSCIDTSSAISTISYNDLSESSKHWIEDLIDKKIKEYQNEIKGQTKDKVVYGEDV